MNLPRIFLLIAAGLLTSCVSTPETRINDNPAVYGGLSPAHKNLVSQGQIKEGMPKEAVYLAWGAPNAKSSGGHSGKSIERWRYLGHYPVWTDSHAFGHSYYSRSRYRGHYNYCPPTVQYITYTQAEVEFANGRVRSWERLR
ncbi:MAG: hypothetical protein AAGA58_00580 [Verrucomicrobiota bacterium]